MQSDKVITIRATERLKEKLDNYFNINKEVYGSKTNLIKSMINNIEFLTGVDPLTVHPDLIKVKNELKNQCKENSELENKLQQIKKENDDLKKEIFQLKNQSAENNTLTYSEEDNKTLERLNESILVIETLIATEFQRNEDVSMNYNSMVHIETDERYQKLKNIINKKELNNTKIESEKKESDFLSNLKKNTMDNFFDM